MTSPLLELIDLTKSYGGVHAINAITMSLMPGEVHALCGENGAGKSTLIKSISGVVLPDAGRIVLQGKPLRMGNVHDAEEAGVAVIHQESTAFPDLNAVDNIFVGRELRYRWGGLLNHSAMRREAARILDRLKQSIRLTTPLRALSVAQRQMVAIGRALSRQCRLLILDEPTASLSARETEVLLAVVEQLRDEGVAILYVSHRLEEIFRIADRVTVLRDGQLVASGLVRETTRPQLIRWMVGHDLPEADRDGMHPDFEQNRRNVRLQVSGLTRHNCFTDISFAVNSHSIVGIAGLVGAGRTELLRSIFGLDRHDHGTIVVDNHRLPSGDIGAAIRHGLALVPEDRQHEGLILPMSVGQNLSMVVLRQLARQGWISRRAEQSLVAGLIAQLGIKAAGSEVAAETLSGGNQQKLVIGKWLATRPKVLLLDEPTRGVDVGAKEQVHRLIRDLAQEGMATLIVSSDIHELLGLCDRILVMCEGRITGEVVAHKTSVEEIFELAFPKTTVTR